MFTSVDSNRKTAEHYSNENVQESSILDNSFIKESNSGIAGQLKKLFSEKAIKLSFFSSIIIGNNKNFFLFGTDGNTFLFSK